MVKGVYVRGPSHVARRPHGAVAGSQPAQSQGSGLGMDLEAKDHSAPGADNERTRVPRESEGEGDVRARPQVELVEADALLRVPEEHAPIERARERESPVRGDGDGRDRSRVSE